ncbi:uncharacterized protein DS421_2g49600 [Arachis hypogaea]|nr:uncharacterized protein DS421_2g49600 [Arachis hypogaea]
MRDMWQRATNRCHRFRHLPLQQIGATVFLPPNRCHRFPSPRRHISVKHPKRP